MKHVYRTCLFIGALAVFSTGGNTAEHPQWEGQITAEALEAVSCEISFISHIVERDMPTGKLVMAKVHCADKRSFDAMRENDAAPFTFKECTPREQKSC